jgi:hypothetical protein
LTVPNKQRKGIRFGLHAEEDTMETE